MVEVVAVGDGDEEVEEVESQVLEGNASLQAVSATKVDLGKLNTPN